MLNIVQCRSVNPARRGLNAYKALKHRQIPVQLPLADLAVVLLPLGLFQADELVVDYAQRLLYNLVLANPFQRLCQGLRQVSAPRRSPSTRSSSSLVSRRGARSCRTRPSSRARRCSRRRTPSGGSSSVRSPRSTSGSRSAGGSSSPRTSTRSWASSNPRSRFSRPAGCCCSPMRSGRPA